MHARRIHLLLILILLCFALCGCTEIPVAEPTPNVTLPPADVGFVAPIGDAALEYTADALLYLPSHDGMSLTVVQTQVAYSPVRPAAETLMRALLAHPASKNATALGGDVRLSLYGTSPVEISRNTVTVNLSASVLQLSREQLFLTCQAIANTLTSLEEIDYVNILVVDKPIGLDIANTLPMGALSKNNAPDLGAVYKQLLSRRAESDNNSDQPLSSSVTLYFPLNGVEGMVSEVRAVSFENQHIADMVLVLLRELASGPRNATILSPTLPLLADLLTSTPSVTSSSETGGDILSLDFAHNMEDMLEAYGITKRQSMASLCYTLTTFFPNLSGIQVSIGGEPVENIFLTETAETSSENVFFRSDFSDMLFDYCTLFFASSNQKTLQKTLRPVFFAQRSNPRNLLCELSKGPQVYDQIQGLLPVMEKNAVSDTDMLGFSLAQETLLVNFSPSFFEIEDELTVAEERLLVYSIVNTLCSNPHFKSICFFQSGSQFEGFTGEIYWAGLFYPLPY